MKNIILRPVFNRPEMLKLSIDCETVARESYKFFSDLYTIFVAEGGTTLEVLNIIKDYPFDYEVIQRRTKFGLTANILEGYKVAFKNADDFVITIEDDILIHSTYFKYIDAVFALGETLPKYSVINATGLNKGEVGYIRKAHHYGPWAPLIDKDFFTRYILPHANAGYYNNLSAKMVELNKPYLKYFETGQYKFKNNRFNEQAGLINRLVDHAMIDEEMYVLTPEINRERNIGYFGKNRPGGSIPGNTLHERIKNLTVIIDTPKLMLKYAGNNSYSKDYALFNAGLDVWDGMIEVR